MNRRCRPAGNPPGNPPAGFQVKIWKPAGGFPGQNLETHHLSDFKKLETRHLGLPMMTQWAKVTKMFQNTKILTDY